MTGNPEPLPLTPILTFRQLLLAELYACTNCVKTFDPVKLSLVTYYWCVTFSIITTRYFMCAQACPRTSAGAAGRPSRVSRGLQLPWPLLPMSALGASEQGAQVH